MNPRFTTNVSDMGGWVRVFLGSGEPTGEVAPYLSQTLTLWFSERPHLAIRMIVPISSNGDTSELHAWYDRSTIPTPAPAWSTNFSGNGK